MNELIKTGKNSQIQVLRAVLCFMIVFYHFTVRYYQIYGIDSIFKNKFISLFSPFGVNSFFLISGFFLLRRNELFTFKDKLLHWLKRFLNIYLPYLAAIAIIYLLSLFNLYGPQRTLTFSGFLQNVFFINLFTKTGYVDGSHWYIISLLFVYLLGFVYDILFNRKNNNNCVFWILILLLSLVSSFVLDYSGFIEKHVKINDFIIKIFTISNSRLCQGRFPYVFIGICLFLFDYDHLTSKKNILLFATVILSLIFIAVGSIVSLIIAIVSITLITLALLRKLTLLEKIKPLIFIGNASFSIYLLHQNIGYMFLNLLTKVLSYYTSLIITIPLIFALGIAFSVFIEKNLKIFINKVIPTHSNKS